MKMLFKSNETKFIVSLERDDGVCAKVIITIPRNMTFEDLENITERDFLIADFNVINETYGEYFTLDEETLIINTVLSAILHNPTRYWVV